MSEYESYSQTIVDELIGLGITDCFLVTGGAVAPLTDALVRSRKVQMHYMLTEQSAAIAAEAYGHYDQNPALLVVTSGPGVTNAMTGVAAAWTNSSPLFVISGQARSQDVEKARNSETRQIGNQHLATEKITNSVVKHFFEPITDFDVKTQIRSMFNSATTGRPGPVWLSLPQDLQRKSIAFAKTTEIQIDKPIDVSSKGDEILEVVEKELMLSSKPLIFLGNGARIPSPHDVFKKLAIYYDAAIVTTWTGIDLYPNDEPHFCGRPGTIASSWEANLVQQNADLVLVLGARLDLAQVGFQPENFAPNAKIYRIEIDPEENFRLPEENRIINLNIDCKRVINFLLSRISEFPRSRTEWWKEIENYRKLPKAGEYRDSMSRISTYDVVESLEKLDSKNVVLGSSGTCVEMVLQSWKISPNQRFLNSGGLGSMGFAISGGIGVAAKIKSGKILIIESDGSLSMNIQDLETVKHITDVEIKIVILNSVGYKSISISQGKQNQILHGESESSGLHLPDIGAWASAAGLNHTKVTDSNLIEEFVHRMWETEGHHLLEFIVSNTEEALPRLMSKPNKNGQMQTADFSHLSPELS